MPESDIAAPGLEDRVTDVDGREVDATMLNWLTFIALHMEEESDFEDDELLDDVLLALGYRDQEERERLRMPRQPHVIGFRDTLDRLSAASLIEKHTRPELRYKLTATVVDDLEEITDRIGTVWSDIGADAIDSVAEFAWLVIIAMRIQDRSQVSRDDLGEKLASLLGNHTYDARHEALTTLLAELEDFGYTEESNTSIWRRVLGQGWALTDRAWGGTYGLHDKLVSDFGEDLLFNEPASPFGDHRSDTTGDAPEADEGNSKAGQLGEQVEGDAELSGRDAAVRVPNDRSDLAASLQIDDTPPSGAAGSDSLDQAYEAEPLAAPLPHGEVVVSDIELCVAVLNSLPTQVDGRNSLSEREIVDSVVERLEIPASYLERRMPPWAQEARWAQDLKKEERTPTLFAYRMEHVFRALSIEQVGLIRDVGLDSDEQDSWSLTEHGRSAVSSDEFQSGNFRYIEEGVHDYFRMHHYMGWQTEDWMEHVVNVFNDMGGELGGVAFELLTKALIEKQRDVDHATVQSSNSYLDNAGVDIVVFMHADSAGGRLLGGMGGLATTTLLVQCKRYFKNEIPPDAASKLFATTAWLRGQAARGELLYDVAGARLAFLGDLSREATWTFWALKSAWDAMEEAARGAGISGSPGRKQPDLTWEIWDGQRIFQLMKEHRVGVAVDADGTVIVDEQYLRDLPNEA